MKRLIQNTIGRLGYGIINTRKFGWDPWQDIRILLKEVETPVLFDVGAHTGETLVELARHFPRAVIHAFEPDPESFSLLQQAARQIPRARVYQLAMGDQPQTAKLLQNRTSMTNSILAAVPERKGEQRPDLYQNVGAVSVTVATLDQFCQAQNIDRIDLLKTDCQGFDLRVLKGAAGLLSKRQVRVIQCEALFDSEYVGQGWFYEILHFLTDMDYAPVAFHNLARNDRREIDWADAFFKPRRDR
jgi:FkbM family methyltransferase